MEAQFISVFQMRKMMRTSRGRTNARTCERWGDKSRLYWCAVATPVVMPERLEKDIGHNRVACLYPARYFIV